MGDGLDGMAVSAIVHVEKFSTFQKFSNIKYTVSTVRNSEAVRNSGISDEEKQSY